MYSSHCTESLCSAGTFYPNRKRGSITEVATDVVHIIYVPSSMGSKLYQDLDKYYITGTIKVP